MDLHDQNPRHLVLRCLVVELAGSALPGGSACPATRGNRGQVSGIWAASVRYLALSWI